MHLTERCTDGSCQIGQTLQATFLLAAETMYLYSSGASIAEIGATALMHTIGIYGGSNHFSRHFAKVWGKLEVPRARAGRAIRNLLVGDIGAAGLPGSIPHTARGLPPGFDLAREFRSFTDFKKAFGGAGSGQAWHHVVEQTVNSGKFADELLHNPANLFGLPHGKGTIHSKISGFYSSKQPFTSGLTVREWLSRKSFREQYEFGIQLIKDFGGAQYLPPHLG